MGLATLHVSKSAYLVDPGRISVFRVKATQGPQLPSVVVRVDVGA